MARNQHGGDCYQCGLWVVPGTGHFEKHGRGWRVKHANVPGHGRVTCEAAKGDKAEADGFEAAALMNADQNYE